MRIVVALFPYEEMDTNMRTLVLTAYQDTWHHGLACQQSLHLQPTKQQGQFMLPMKGKLQISASHAAHVNMKQVVTQADDTLTRSRKFLCSSELQLYILFLLCLLYYNKL